MSLLVTLEAMNSVCGIPVSFYGSCENGTTLMDLCLQGVLCGYKSIALASFQRMLWLWATQYWYIIACSVKEQSVCEGKSYTKVGLCLISWPRWGTCVCWRSTWVTLLGLWGSLLRACCLLSSLSLTGLNHLRIDRTILTSSSNWAI